MNRIIELANELLAEIQKQGKPIISHVKTENNEFDIIHLEIWGYDLSKDRVSVAVSSRWREEGPLTVNVWPEGGGQAD